MVAALSISLPIKAEILIQDDFESYVEGVSPAGDWSTSSNNEASILVATNAFNSPGKSVQILQTDDGGTGWLTQYHEPQLGLVTYKAFLRSNNTSRETITMSARQSGWPPGPWIAVGYHPGWISYFDGSAWYDVIQAANDQWYEIKLEVDVSAQTYNIFINDMVTPLVTGADFWDNSITQLESIRFEVYQTGGVDPNIDDAAWVDDVLVTTLEGSAAEQIPMLPPLGLAIIAAGISFLAFRRLG